MARKVFTVWLLIHGLSFVMAACSPNNQEQSAAQTEEVAAKVELDAGTRRETAEKGESSAPENSKRAAAAPGGCDLDRGERAFQKCSICHSLAAGDNRAGPSLHGLLSRRAGSAPDFGYSPAFAAADFVWTDEALDAFLENPMQYLPGTVMPLAGIKDHEERAEIACWIKANSPATAGGR